MKAVILNMTVDKRWWLQCCLKSDTHAGVHVQTNTHTHTETKVRLSFKQEIMYQKYSVLLLYTLSHAHPHLLVSSLISIIALEVLLCDFILFKAPQWHHGECIGHLTHAPHVSEYISNTAISSRLLKHHVPHGAVWVGGLNIYRWISSLKMSSSLQYKTPYCISCPNVSFFLPWCFMSPLSLTAVGQKRATFEPRYRGLLFETVAMPDIVLTQTCLTQRPSVCMHYWLVLHWLFATLTELNRSESLAC